MRIRKFEAETVRDAMEQARRELGEDAVILNTREIRPLPGARASGRPRVELVAASDGVPSAGSGTLTLVDDTGDSGGHGGADLAGELAALRSALESLVGEGVLVAHTRSQPGPERKLRDAGVDCGLAIQIARSLREAASPEEAAAQWECLFDCSRPTLPDGCPGVWAAVGPSGSGKTTAVARMAAHYSIREKKSVAIISCDGERIGASEQLSRIAGALGVAFRECLQPEAVSSALDDFGTMDIVLIDTPGGSVRDTQSACSLRRLLADERIACHLVLPASLSVEARSACLRAFEPLDPQRVIVTKLDETPTALPLLCIAQATPAPFSFLCEGASLAGGLRDADPGEIAALVLEDLR